MVKKVSCGDSEIYRSNKERKRPKRKKKDVDATPRLLIIFKVDLIIGVPALPRIGRRPRR
jgi:hypothetical protein